MGDTGELIAAALTVDGRERTVMLRLPDPLPARRPIPLVLVLHGNMTDYGDLSAGFGARAMRDWTTFDQQADALGWAVAYPDGHLGCWADGRGVTAADEAGVDDVAFLRTAIDWLADHFGTAPDQVVATGISNGGFMAHHLALAVSDRIPVFAAVAGQLPAALHEVEPTHAVSALLIHGSVDRISPITGGFSRRRGPNGELRGRTLSLVESMDRWRAIDRCATESQTHTTDGSSRVGAEDGVGGTRVVAWTVFGGGHSWPGGVVDADWPEPTSQEFDAAEEICRFAAPLLATHENRLRRASPARSEKPLA